MKENRRLSANEKRSYERPVTRIVRLQSEGRLLQVSMNADARNPYNQVPLGW